MNRTSAVLGSIVFFFLAPFVVAGVIPWGIGEWRMNPPPFGVEETRIAGLALAAVGFTILVDSFARFALQGFGTPAPVAPPRQLIVTGLYRHVRNPMYVGVLAFIFGQALFFADARLAAYGVIVWLMFHAFVWLYEEPTLQRMFGAEYEAFRANVPRWIPRLTPWPGGKLPAPSNSAGT